jgi:hypothetical protein
MSIERLKQLVLAPNQPTEQGTTEQWIAIESELGTPLPQDYRLFICTYGTGLFANLYIVLNPFSVSEHIALLPAIRTIRETYQEMSHITYPMFPDPGGLLPWGKDENGNFYFWVTKGEPNGWNVVEHAVRGDGFRQHDCSMTEFLVGILERKITALASCYPNDRSYRFVSYHRGQL